MKKKLPPLNWLRSFEAAARHLSFTAAADELNLTQSAISQQIRSLEVQLGIMLFTRKARGLALTDEARKLVPKVSSALEMLSAATDAFDTGPKEGLLTVAASVSILQWLIAPKLPEFTRANPDLRIRFLSTIWPDDFKASIADVEIRFGSEKQVGHNASRLWPDQLIVVANPHLLDNSAAPSFENATLIEAVGTSEGWHSWAKKAGYPVPLSPSIYVDSYGTALDFARSGAGFSVTSSLLAQSCLEAGHVVQAHSVLLDSTEGYFLAVNEKSKPAKTFANWLFHSD